MWPVTSTNVEAQDQSMPEPPGQKNDHEAESQNMGTQQDHTVTQSHFSGLGLPEQEYLDGTVLIWRFEEVPAAYAMRDERLARVAGYGDARVRGWDRPDASGRGLRASESASAMLARLGTDAQLWAREFIERFGGDEHLLLTWLPAPSRPGARPGTRGDATTRWPVSAPGRPVALRR
jgi:hypothetical protein